MIKLAQSDFSKHALKRATKWHAREVKKRVRREYDGIKLHPAMIRCYVNANLAGMLPLKVGVMGDVPAASFKVLCTAFESYIRICQINSQEGKITFKKLAAKINPVLRHDYRQKMLQRVLLATAKDLDALTMHIAKD